MSPLLFLLTAIAVLITSFISGIFGMAGGIILMGFLLAVLTVPAAMVLHGITQMASNGWRAWLWRNKIQWRIVRGYALGMLLALAIFLAVRLVVSTPIAYILLGMSPFVSWLLPTSLAFNVDKKGHAFLCGLLCMVMQLLTGVSGVLLDMFYVQSALDRRQVIATKATSQTLGHIVKIIYFGGLGVGLLGELSASITAMCIITAMIGATVSRRVLEKMSDNNFRRWTRGIVYTTGTAYLLYGIYLQMK